MIFSRFLRGGAFLLLVLCGASPLPALDVPLRHISDDSSLRISLRDSWFTEVPSVVLNKTPLLRALPGGGRVEVRSEAAGEEFVILLARELTGSFPGWAQGSWALTRRRDDGSPVRMRVFPQTDFNNYVQFRPFSKDRCLMDVVIYNAYVVNSLPLPVPFERLYTLPLEEILGMAEDKFPRRYFEPRLDAYRDARAFVAAVRGRIGEVGFRDDGAMDENGRYVFIGNLAPQEGEPGLNCSGFAKWVTDGILRPLTGERLSVGPLKARFGERGSGFTQPWEELRDPFFGLDWTRNLASAANRILRAPAFGDLAEIEVRDAPFSAVIRRDERGAVPRPFPGYLPDTGFSIEGLHPLLYTLAIDEPGRIYLASVNGELGAPVTKDNPRGLPRMRQHFHVAALVPYFTSYGNFRVALFESAEETQFSAFKTRYPPDCQVNLVRIPVETSFDP
ncbi:MAG: hypothetical protein LBG14_03415 [Treponema sp.]|jgi:hypothetical protein|nr:hypothetical protein [Treponema sp.]